MKTLKGTYQYAIPQVSFKHSTEFYLVSSSNDLPLLLDFYTTLASGTLRGHDHTTSGQIHTRPRSYQLGTTMPTLISRRQVKNLPPPRDQTVVKLWDMETGFFAIIILAIIPIGYAGSVVVSKQMELFGYPRGMIKSLCVRNGKNKMREL
jgi:hypothetical protein